MTDDITRGLVLLADEAEPATVNTDEVITRARARTRNRRATAATALATVAVISALVATVAITSDRSTPPAKSSERLVDRLNRQLTQALPHMIPAGWSLTGSAPLTFECPTNVDMLVPNGTAGPFCEAQADYRDDVGALDVVIRVHKFERDFALGCDEPHCTRWGSPVQRDLPDGTTTELVTYTEKPTSRDIQELWAARPDGTQLTVVVLWQQGQRSKTPLTTDQILRFATAFDFGDAVVPTSSPSPTPKTDWKKAARLTSALNDVLETAIPAGWSRAPAEEQPDESPFTFDCGEGTLGPGTGDGTPEDDPRTMMSCWTAGYYRDTTGLIGIKFSVSPDQIFGGTCADSATECVEKNLPDGTKTQLKRELHDPVATYTHSVSAFRPDGTVIWVEVFWTDQRSQTPLTDQQLLKFATAFTY